MVEMAVGAGDDGGDVRSEPGMTVEMADQVGHDGGRVGDDGERGRMTVEMAGRGRG